MTSKCTHQILSESCNGSVTRCAKCQEIQLVYNNVVTKFNYDEFLFFESSISSIDPKSFIGTFFKNKNILIQSGISNVVFAFDESELSELKLLLHDAVILLETFQILSKS
ncbi:hypothetical protein QQ008_28440 [Fulvivirgaceae bacterium BMA10]|uniref:Uncharacterized protein n=1 Tax=Splendidivirga corallicola TaxID=3051826 RepID=A0ABT8KX62_9BACT|nr:hypothetical protein [Fulvivirgaceae bacterium BMA10]